MSFQRMPANSLITTYSLSKPGHVSLPKAVAFQTTKTAANYLRPRERKLLEGEKVPNHE